MENANPNEVLKVYPCDPELRERLRTMRAAGEVTNAVLAKASRMNDSVVSQYLNDDGCIYPGDIQRAERKLRSWLERRSLENLAGIPTIPTAVSEQIASAARMIRRCGIMGKGIGRAGIGKTRGAMLLRSADESATLLFCVSAETGTREAVRSALFSAMGIQGPRKRSASRRRVMYADLAKRLRGADTLLVYDQAHRLSLPAMEFLAELWNDTHSPQLWLGTGALTDKLERDEQVASRVAFTFDLSVIVDKDTNEVRPVVEHQIKSRLPKVDGEFKPLAKLCERLALRGSFRRVEMHLATMLFLAVSPRNAGRSWVELFEQASSYLPAIETESL
jgi:DNA transposition AAA+ family ATPase